LQEIARKKRRRLFQSKGIDSNTAGLS
jgi:hypothetical protein